MVIRMTAVKPLTAAPASLSDQIRACMPPCDVGVSQPRVDAQKCSLDEDGFWPINPDVAIEVKSRTDDRGVSPVARIRTFIERGSAYAVAINPETREVVPGGTPPPGLSLDDAIIDA